MKAAETTVLTWIATVFLLATSTIVILLSIQRISDRLDTAEIAGTRVPPVSCQEDEAIWWIGVDQLGCVHFEAVR